jgi:hypothetical protein
MKIASCGVLAKNKRVVSSNILIDKDFRGLLPKGAGNFEGQRQVRVKSALFNGVDGLAGHAHMGGQLCLGPLPFRA